MSDVLDRRADVDFHDGLENRWFGLFHTLLKSERSGNLERHFGRIDVVILTVQQTDAEVDDRKSRQESLASRVLNPFFHRRNVLARNRSAEDLVDKFEIRSAGQRLNRDLAVGELSMSGGLVFVASMRIGGFGDGLAVRNLRRMKNHVDAVLLLQLRDDDLDVELPLTAEQKFLGLLVAMEPDRRILLHDSRERGADLVFVSARFPFNRE